MTNRAAIIFTKIATGAKTFFAWIGGRLKQLFAAKQPDEPATTPTTVAANNLDTNEPFDQYNTHVSQLEDVVVRLGLHQRISASQQYMYEMGRRDGALGVQLKNLADLAKATAQEMFRHIYVVIQGNLAALLAEKDTLKSIMEYDELCHERNRAYHDYVQYQYRFFPRSYSWWLGGFYALVALLLILADMPLALKLIREGFNIAGGGQPHETIPRLFIGNFWRIIALNWETFTTAVGIALCTVYIKIYYDEFIGTPYANKTMTIARFAEENRQSVSGDVLQNEDTQRDIKHEYRGKRWWKTGLAIFTVASIVVLAFFRQETAVAVQGIKFTAISKAAFIVITVLFPIIGGICLSHALTNFQNRRRLNRAVKKCKESMDTYLQAVDRYTVAQKNHEDIKAASDRLCDEDHMIREYIEYLIAFYRRGEATGSLQPDKYTKGEDFFAKVLEWRNVAISRKINHHISQLN